MLKDSLHSEYGLVPLHHEMELAANLMHRGFDVTFADIEGDERFDLLAVRDGAELEVECETVSGDIGRQIHRRRLYALSRRLAPVVDGALGRLEGGRLLRVVLAGRLGGDMV